MQVRDAANFRAGSDTKHFGADMVDGEGSTCIPCAAVWQVVQV